MFHKEVTVPWACRVLDKGGGSRLEGPSAGCCWPPGPAERYEPMAGRQHQALQRGGMGKQGWKHPSSLLRGGLWLAGSSDSVCVAWAAERVGLPSWWLLLNLFCSSSAEAPGHRGGLSKGRLPGQ